MDKEGYAYLEEFAKGCEAPSAVPSSPTTSTIGPQALPVVVHPIGVVVLEVETERDKPINMYEFNKPSGWIAFMDTQDGWGMYSPANWRFTLDLDGDGIVDSTGTDALYNWAAARVHLEGMNVTMIDGHREWMSFQDFLNPDHPNWTNIP